MVLIFIYSFIYIFFITIDLIPLYQDKKWKSFWAYSLLVLLSYTVLCLMVLGVTIPSPAVAIKNAITALFGLSG